jgi:hypothetical protein
VKDPQEKNPDEDLLFDPQKVQEKVQVLQKELSQKRAQLQLLLKSIPHEEPEKNSEDWDAYTQIKSQIDQLKKQILDDQNALMELLKEKSDLDEKEEKEL